MTFLETELRMLRPSKTSSQLYLGYGYICCIYFIDFIKKKNLKGHWSQKQIIDRY